MTAILLFADSVHPWTVLVGLLLSVCDASLTHWILSRTGPRLEVNLVFRLAWNRFGKNGFWLAWTCIAALFLAVGFGSPAFSLSMCCFWLVLILNNLIVVWGVKRGVFESSEVS